MGLFKTDPNKKAERLRRRAQRKAAKAAAAEAQANALAPDEEETAMLTARGPQGRQVQQEVKLKKRSSRVRNERLKVAEKKMAEMEAEVESLEEANQALEERIEKLETHLNRRNAQNVMFSASALKAAQGLIRILNVQDRPKNPGAIVVAEAFKMADLVGVTGVEIDQDTANWAEVLATALTAYGYYDPQHGFGSIFGSDPRVIVNQPAPKPEKR